MYICKEKCYKYGGLCHKRVHISPCPWSWCFAASIFRSVHLRTRFMSNFLFTSVWFCYVVMFSNVQSLNIQYARVKMDNPNNEEARRRWKVAGCVQRSSKFAQILFPPDCSAMGTCGHGIYMFDNQYTNYSRILILEYLIQWSSFAK